MKQVVVEYCSLFLDVRKLLSQLLDQAPNESFGTGMTGFTHSVSRFVARKTGWGWSLRSKVESDDRQVKTYSGRGRTCIGLVCSIEPFCGCLANLWGVGIIVSSRQLLLSHLIEQPFRHFCAVDFPGLTKLMNGVFPLL